MLKTETVNSKAQDERHDDLSNRYCACAATDFRLSWMSSFVNDSFYIFLIFTKFETRKNNFLRDRTDFFCERKWKLDGLQVQQNAMIWFWQKWNDGYHRSFSVTQVLLQTGLPSFDTVLHNGACVFIRVWHNSQNLLVQYLNSVDFVDWLFCCVAG